MLVVGYESENGISIIAKASKKDVGNGCASKTNQFSIMFFTFFSHSALHKPIPSEGLFAH